MALPNVVAGTLPAWRARGSLLNSSVSRQLRNRDRVRNRQDYSLRSQAPLKQLKLCCEINHYAFKMNFLVEVKNPDNGPSSADNLTRNMTTETDAAHTERSYHLYRRRWYGVLVILAMNLMSSWGVRYFNHHLSSRA